MHRNITIGEKAYDLLASLKSGKGDSFTKVILRHVRKPAATGGELLDALENYVPPIEPDVFEKFAGSRGRRSKRK